MAAKKTYDLIVVGSGPGGYVAAVRAAQLGMTVACIEKAPRLGGACLNVGCIPSKALLDSSEYYHLAQHHFRAHGIQTGQVRLDLKGMMARKDQVVKELTENVKQLLDGHKVQIIRGTAALKDKDRVEVTPAQKASGKARRRVLEAKAILLATGSVASALPGIAFDGKKIVSSTEALRFNAVPKHLAIVGGSYIGLELGSVWQRLGAKVTIIEMLPQIAPASDGQVARTLQRILKQQGLSFMLKARLEKARILQKSVQLTVSADGKTEKLSCDRLLLAVGRKPNTEGLGLDKLGVQTDPESGHVVVDECYRTSVPTIYAIGDLTPGPMLAHKASAEGVAAVECLAGLAGEVNYDAVPAVVYTWPEVASVGLTEEQVKARGIPYCVGTFPFSGAGRARCMGEKDGFVKLIAHGKSDRVLGVHIIGPRAADMIAECVLALEFNASAEDISRTIHGHPTFSEALQEAAMGIRQCSIYAS